MHRPPSPSPFNFNWRILALAGGGALLLALLMHPASAGYKSPSDTASAATAAAPATLAGDASPADNQPRRFSILDLVGKISLAVLLIYGVSFGLSRAKRLGLGGSLLPTPTDRHQRLQLRETLSLGRQIGNLYLVEVDDQVLLLGATTDQIYLLWQPAPASTCSFKPVPEEPDFAEPADPPAAPRFDVPLFQRGFGAPARRESDWAQQRSQLINALIQSE